MRNSNDEAHDETMAITFSTTIKLSAIHMTYVHMKRKDWQVLRQ